MLSIANEVDPLIFAAYVLYALSIANEVDPLIFAAYVLYAIQTCIFPTHYSSMIS